MNWKIRISNKTFWLALIPAIALVITSVADVFGYTIDFTEGTAKLAAVVEAVFALLAVLGVVIDPTTKGIGDSEHALQKSELD